MFVNENRTIEPQTQTASVDIRYKVKMMKEAFTYIDKSLYQSQMTSKNEFSENKIRQVKRI
jgi:hypothetical protein